MIHINLRFFPFIFYTYLFYRRCDLNNFSPWIAQHDFFFFFFIKSLTWLNIYFLSSWGILYICACNFCKFESKLIQWELLWYSMVCTSVETFFFIFYHKNLIAFHIYTCVANVVHSTIDYNRHFFQFYLFNSQVWMGAIAILMNITCHPFSMWELQSMLSTLFPFITSSLVLLFEPFFSSWPSS